MCLFTHRSHRGPRSLHPLSYGRESQCGGKPVRKLQRKQKRPSRMVNPSMECAQAQGLLLVASYSFFQVGMGSGLLTRCLGRIYVVAKVSEKGEA